MSGLPTRDELERLLHSEDVPIEILPDGSIRKLEPEWKDVASPHVGDYTERLKVPGGWLYRLMMYAEDKNPEMLSDRTQPPAVAMVFVPEPFIPDRE